MQRAGHRARPTLAAFAALAVLLPGAARAIPLGTLVGGGDLTSADGAVTWSGFSVSFASAIYEGDNALRDLDLMLVDVSVVESGALRILAMEGPIEVDAFELGQMRIGYQVDAGAGFAIDGAGISLKAETLGWFASASVVESISGDVASVLRALEADDETLRSPFDDDVFAGQAGQLAVSSEIALDGGMSSGSRIARLEQGFSVTRASSPVPEPGGALLFGAGTLVVALRLRRTRT